MAMGEIFREWDGLDVLAVSGMLVASGGVIASLLPRCRRIELLFPIAIGTAMIAVAAYGARYSDGEILEREEPSVIGPPSRDRYPKPA